MSTQHADTDMIDAVDNRDQAELDAIANIDVMMTHIQSVLQSQQPTIFLAVHVPKVQSPYTPNSSGQSRQLFGNYLGNYLMIFEH